MRSMSPPEHKIRVEVETSYLDEQSDPRESRYVFSYTITIRNEGKVPARLLTRHWVITDANGKVEEVRSEEHTSELQSQSNLVCRLLLDKKYITSYKAADASSTLTIDRH